jgi:MSHA biogenesis protein MshI
MQWPWPRSRISDRLVMAWSGHAMAYVQATPMKEGGRFDVWRFGVERQGADSAEEFAKRLAALGFKGCQALGMLRSGQYQMLQIDAPAVAPDELRAAARWKIRDMVDMHLDDLTLDVMRVGDEQARATANLFVVTAANALIRELMEISKAMRCTLDVIDIQGLAHRNLQTALARRDGRLTRARAAIVLMDERYALLTITANEELYYKRRIDLGGTFPLDLWNPDSVAAQNFVVEVQRSLDLWERTWQELPLEEVNVFAGAHTNDMVQILTQQLIPPVSELDVSTLFPGFEGGSDADRMLCWPLLGVLLRTESRKL